MTDSISIQPSHDPVQGSIRPPGSKSITNRALICAALADQSSILTGALDSEDTRLMIAALRDLGVSIESQDDSRTLLVEGSDGKIPSFAADLDVGNSGTTIRFLTPVVTLGHGRFRLDGVDRMRKRPIGDLTGALNQLGADAQCQFDNGCPPVVVNADGLTGGEAVVRGNISSQFLSGLLMAAPYAQSPTYIRVDGELVSRPYVEMTLAIMRAFGANLVTTESLTKFDISGGDGYTGRQYSIEPDASAASYFWAAAAITGGQVTVDGLSKSSLQGDTVFCEVLARMGCQVDYYSDRITVRGRALHGIDVDMNAISDTVQTLAAVALFADGPTTIRNVGHIRHKETDRIAALANELRKLGANVTERDDGLVIKPGSLRGTTIETYNDHRMAMSLALVGLRTPGVTILDPDCTQKTYPNFFADLAEITSD